MKKKVIIIITILVLLIITFFAVNLKTFTIEGTRENFQEYFDYVVIVEGDYNTYFYEVENLEVFEVGNTYYGWEFPGCAPIILGLNGDNITEY